MHPSETDDSSYNNLIEELCKANKTLKALSKCWAYSKCSEHNSFYFYLWRSTNRRERISHVMKAFHWETWKTIVLASFITTWYKWGSFWKREPQLRNCPYKIGLWAILWCIFLIGVGGFGSRWAVSSLGQWSWLLWKAVYISQEEQARKQHSCMVSLSVSVSGVMACLSSCFSFSQWCSVTWKI